MMNSFLLVLKLSALMFFLVAALHLILGLQADALLGAQIPTTVMIDPVLDSQNRFYGTSFALYGVMLLVVAADPHKYGLVLHCVLWTLFAGGLARLVAIASHGRPTPPVLGLLVLELVAPPLMLWWFAQVAKAHDELR